MQQDCSPTHQSADVVQGGTKGCMAPVMEKWPSLLSSKTFQQKLP